MEGGQQNLMFAITFEHLGIRTLIIFLSHDVVSGSDIMPCSKIDKPLVR